MISHLDNGAANNYDFCMCPRIAGGLNEAALYFGGRPPNNIYVWMEERNWKKTLQEAYMNMLGIKEEV